METSHLLFVNDTMLFCDLNSNQLGYIRYGFLYFEGVSGLEVNLSKSELVLVEVEGVIGASLSSGL
jgi:hypothetical protein